MSKTNIESDALAASLSEFSDTISHGLTGILEKLSGKELSAEDQEKADVQKKKNTRYNKWTQLIANNGYSEAKNKHISVKDMAMQSMQLASNPANDAVTSEWYNNMMPSIITAAIREPLEVGSPLTALLTQVRFSAASKISFPFTGPAGNLNLDMAEGEEYPILDLDLSGSVTSTIGKSGIAVAFTEETLRYASFDIVGLHLRQAQRALKRHKEAKAADMIFSIGSVWSDNNSTDSSVRRTTGRDINGNYNGTLIVDDLVDATLDARQEGWSLDTIVVNPLGWQIFAKDPILREQFFRGLAGGSFVNQPSGQAAYYPELGSNAYGKNLGGSVGLGLPNGADLGGSQSSTLSFAVPGYAGFGFNVIVSPYAPISWDAANNRYLTDILILEAEHAGLLIIDEDIALDKWTDPARDIQKMKMRERYALAQVNAGRAARVLKNVAVERAYFTEDNVRYDVSNGPLPLMPYGTSSSS